jgi:hypothetical protein
MFLFKFTLCANEKAAGNSGTRWLLKSFIQGGAKGGKTNTLTKKIKHNFLLSNTLTSHL